MSSKLVISIITALAMQGGCSLGAHQSVKKASSNSIKFMNDLSLFFMVNQRQTYSDTMDEFIDELDEEDEISYEEEIEDEEMELLSFEDLNEEPPAPSLRLMTEFETIAIRALLKTNILTNETKSFLETTENDTEEISVDRLFFSDLDELPPQEEDQENESYRELFHTLPTYFIAQGRHDQTISAGLLKAKARLATPLITKNEPLLLDSLFPKEFHVKKESVPRAPFIPQGRDEETVPTFAYSGNKTWPQPLYSASSDNELTHSISDETFSENLAENVPQPLPIEPKGTTIPLDNPSDEGDQQLLEIQNEDQDPFTLSGESAHIGRELGVNAYSAVLDPMQKTGLYAQIIYPVTKIWKRMGDRFEKGDMLIQLDDSIANGNYNRAVALVDEAFSKFKAIGELYKSELASLFELKEAEAEVAKSKAELTLAETNLKATQIAAPYSGIVDTVFISEYELPQTGRELIKILGDEILIAKMLVPSKLLPYLQIGTPIVIHLSEIKEVIHAKVSRIGGMIDAASSTLKIEAEIDNSEQKYKAGISGIATFDTPLQDINLRESHYYTP